jgi:hypothetical protein
MPYCVHTNFEFDKKNSRALPPPYKMVSCKCGDKCICPICKAGWYNEECECGEDIYRKGERPCNIL